MDLWLGVRVTRKFRVGFFGFLKFRVFKSSTRNLFKINKTRHFGYSTFRVRVRVYPNNPRYNYEGSQQVATQMQTRKQQIHEQAAGVASKQGCKQQAAGVVAIASKQPASQAAGKPPEYSAPPVVLWCRPPLRGRASVLPLIRCAPVAAAAGHVAARRRAPAAAAARRRDADTAGRPVTAAPRHALHPLAICGGAVTRRSRRRRRRG